MKGDDILKANAAYAREQKMKRADKRAASVFRKDPDRSVRIRKMTSDDLRDTLAWLAEEMDTTGRINFYVNRNVIESAQRDGEAFVSRAVGYCIGVLVVDRNSSPAIIATRPGYRRRGVGRAMLAYCVRRALRRGEKAVRVRCVTLEGKALCRAFGFVLETSTGGPGAFTDGDWRMTFSLADPDVDLFI